MNRAIILHSVKDAKDCIKKRLHLNNLLFSTNSSVDVYLREAHHVTCHVLSNSFTADEIINNLERLSKVVDCILFSLDEKITPIINEHFGLRMKFFMPLYSYLGKHHFLVYLCFAESIKKIIHIYNLESISFYDHRFNSFIDLDSDMEYFLSFFPFDIETSVLRSFQRDSLLRLRLERLMTIINKLKQRPFGKIKKAFKRSMYSLRCQRFSNKKKTILLYEYLYDLDFLKEKLLKYNILYKVPSGIKCNDSITKFNINFKESDFVGENNDPLMQIFLEDIKKDFKKNIVGYINGIATLRSINKKYPISLGIWGNPPLLKLKALVFEFLKSENIKVVGAQHGSLYGDSFHPWHFDSDFDRCNYFISYGFTKEDLDRLYPGHEVKCKVLPLGKASFAKRNRFRKDIDILFPIAASSSMFDVGMKRIPPHQLAERQIMILEYLNSLKGLTVYVKPLPFSTLKNCSVLPIFKRLKNIKVVYNMFLTEFLRRYTPRAILMEFPSMPLFESLCVDSEIFLMGDCTHPLEEQAFDKLKKRIHYSEEINEMIKKLDLFFKGKLEKKRDQAFYNHYIYRQDSKENILGVIDTLINGHDK